MIDDQDFDLAFLLFQSQAELVLNLEMGLPFVASQRRMVLSPQVEAMRTPSGDQATAETEKLGSKPY